MAKIHVGREASRRLEPSICFAYTSLDRLSSIDPIGPRYTHESPRSHHLGWTRTPVGGLDPGGFKDVTEKCEMILVEKKKQSPNMETEKWREKAGY